MPFGFPLKRVVRHSFCTCIPDRSGTGIEELFLSGGCLCASADGWRVVEQRDFPVINRYTPPPLFFFFFFLPPPLLPTLKCDHQPLFSSPTFSLFSCHTDVTRLSQVFPLSSFLYILSKPQNCPFLLR